MSCWAGASARRSPWCRPASTSPASARATAARARRELGPRRRAIASSSTWADWTARRAWSACSWPSSGSPATLPRTRLLVVGQGTQAEALRRLAVALSDGRSHPLRRAASLTTRCRSATGRPTSSSSPRETETQGLVLAEAAACGLPAVAVDAPGCAEVVQDGESGIADQSRPRGAGRGGHRPAARRRASPGHGPARPGGGRAGVRRRLQIDRTLEVYEEARARVARSAR